VVTFRRFESAACCASRSGRWNACSMTHPRNRDLRVRFIAEGPRGGSWGVMHSMSSVCRECGMRSQMRRATREFCSSACRRQFNNRRALRGADLYDVLMCMRYDRDNAEGALSLLCRMASNFRALDRREREGRRSWLGLERISTRNGHLAARVVGINVAGTMSAPKPEGASAPKLVAPPPPGRPRRKRRKV
jgi:hypothetical protein